MRDYYIRATAANGQIRAFAANTTQMVDKAAKIHSTSPVASAALGRTLTAASFMGLMTGNNDDLITISIKGDGPIGGVLATSDGLGRVKGYVHNPQGNTPNKPNGKLDVSAAIGFGHITVTKDLGLKEPYAGTLELISGEIAEDIAGYCFQSEQTPTVLSLGVTIDKDYSIKQSGGFLIQLMPGYDDAIVDQLEAIMTGFPSLTQLLDLGETPETILDLLLAEFGYNITEKNEISYYCDCARHRVKSAVMSIGTKDLSKIIEEDGQAEVTCHFCAKQYIFEKDELEEMLNSSR